MTWISIQGMLAEAMSKKRNNAKATLQTQSLLTSMLSLNTLGDVPVMRHLSNEQHAEFKDQEASQSSDRATLLASYQKLLGSTTHEK